MQKSEVSIEGMPMQSQRGTTQSFSVGMSSSYCILLYSSLDRMHASNVLVLKVVLLAYHNPQAFLKQRNIIFEEIDGALPSNKDMRNALFEVAGMERNRAL